MTNVVYEELCWIQIEGFLPVAGQVFAILVPYAREFLHIDATICAPILQN